MAGGYVRKFAVIGISALALFGQNARAVTPTFELTLDGPRRAEIGTPTTYSGRLLWVELDRGLPLQRIEVCVNEPPALPASCTEGRTDADGNYSIDITFDEPGIYSLQAYANRGTKEIKSNPIEVSAGSFDLTVTLSGTGMGVVSSNPVGISCPSDCSEAFNFGTTVTLTATPDSTTSNFAGWFGDCSGTGSCVVNLNANRSVGARFDLVLRQLTVVKSGDGVGTVSGPGINCGSDCSESYPHGTSITLTAQPQSGTSNFIGWTGPCSGTGACVVTMNASKSVGARFDLIRRLLTVGRAGDGNGTVTGPGINCGGDCSELYPHGTGVGLSANSSFDSYFTSWSGSCPGGCTMDADKSATASFTLKVHVWKGARINAPDCTSIHCRFLHINWTQLSSGTHTIRCHSNVYGVWYTYTRSGSSGDSENCYYGYPGHVVWATIDGIPSNSIVW